MKNTLLIVLIFSFTNTQAQRGYVERAIEKNYEKKHGEPGEKKGNDWLNNHLLNVDVEEEYTFPTAMKMHITNYKKGVKKDESDLQYYFNSGGTIIGFLSINEKKKKDEMFMIYDYVKNAMIMLNEKDKTGMAMNINAFRSKESIERRNEEMKSGKARETNTTCKATGKTKTIRGYVCTGYTCYDLDTDTRSEIWVSSKIPFDVKKMDARNPLAPYYKGTSGYNGMMMEGDFYKGDELTSTIEVTDINTAANYIVKTTDYKFNK